jgi:hypothetical protein
VNGTPVGKGTSVLLMVGRRRGWGGGGRRGGWTEGGREEGREGRGRVPVGRLLPPHLPSGCSVFSLMCCVLRSILLLRSLTRPSLCILHTHVSSSPPGCFPPSRPPSRPPLRTATSSRCIGRGTPISRHSLICIKWRRRDTQTWLIGPGGTM